MNLSIADIQRGLREKTLAPANWRTVSKAQESTGYEFIDC